MPFELKINPSKCTGCRICEFACGYHRDREFTAISSSLILSRNEKKNYYGIVLKRQKDLCLGRPEGIEFMLPGTTPASGASAKPITMREPCDGCEGEEKAFCVETCPTGSLFT